MKSIIDEIRRVEADLRKREIPISRLLEMAGINKSTFYRWRSGTNAPLHQSWEGLMAAFAKLGGK